MCSNLDLFVLAWAEIDGRFDVKRNQIYYSKFWTCRDSTAAQQRKEKP